MSRRIWVVCTMSLGLAGLFLVSSVSSYSTGSGLNFSLPAAGTKDKTPAYHAEPPNGSLPATIDPKEFHDTLNQNIYALAAEVKEVLYQQPCYCYCDRNRRLGHKSLLDCFVDKHATECELCKKEAVYDYLQSKAGKTPTEIREDIIEGKWKEVDLTKYNREGTAN